MGCWFDPPHHCCLLLWWLIWPTRDCIKLYTSSCTLRSASETHSLQIPRTTDYYYVFMDVQERFLSIVGSRAFYVFGPSTWNDLPLPLRQKPHLDSFKCNLKTFLFPKLWMFRIHPDSSTWTCGSTIRALGILTSEGWLQTQERVCKL